MLPPYRRKSVSQQHALNLRAPANQRAYCKVIIPDINHCVLLDLTLGFSLDQIRQLLYCVSPARASTFSSDATDLGIDIAV